MKKRNFKIYVFLSVAIIILGLFLLLYDKKVFVPGSLTETPENWLWNGWIIMFVGMAMLLHGLFIKWTISKERSRNQSTTDPPSTELIENTIYFSDKSDKDTYSIKLNQNPE